MSVSPNFDHIVELCQNEINYCSACQPSDGRHVYWALGERKKLENLFNQFDIPESEREQVAEELVCPHCGASFQRGMDYGSEKAYIDRKFAEWKHNYQETLEDFTQFLYQYPYLGGYHQFGKKVIDSMVDFPSTDISDQIWYRARNIEDGRLFRHRDMLPPNPKRIRIPEGRYNHFGQSHWYLADSDYCAAAEVLTMKNDDKLVWMQKVKIKQLHKVVDVSVMNFAQSENESIPILASGIIYYSKVLNKNVKRSENWKPEYFIPRFIADCAKFYDFSGIIFNSQRHYGKNLVIFDRSTTVFEFIDEPYVFEYRMENEGMGNTGS